jgi:hypothetical protein
MNESTRVKAVARQKAWSAVTGDEERAEDLIVVGRRINW